MVSGIQAVVFGVQSEMQLGSKVGSAGSAAMHMVYTMAALCSHNKPRKKTISSVLGCHVA